MHHGCGAFFCLDPAMETPARPLSALWFFRMDPMAAMAHRRVCSVSCIPPSSPVLVDGTGILGMMKAEAGQHCPAAPGTRSIAGRNM